MKISLAAIIIYSLSSLLLTGCSFSGQPKEPIEEKDLFQKDTAPIRETSLFNIKKQSISFKKSSADDHNKIKRLDLGAL